MGDKCMASSTVCHDRDIERYSPTKAEFKIGDCDPPMQASGLKAFRETNKLEHLPEDIAKYKFASEIWEKGMRPDLEYFDWLLRDTQA